DITSAPAAPSSLTAAEASTSEVDLAWSESSTNVTKFKIERSTDNVTFTQITTVAAGVTTYNNTGLTANTTYSYRVRASNTAGSSAFSTVANSSTLHGTPTQRFVFQVYQDLLGRRVDAPALVSWTNVLNTGTSRGQMVEMIESSVEYRTDEVESLYQEFLGRPVDSGSLQSWVTFLGAGGTSKQVTAMILGSDEFFTNEGNGTVTGFLSALYQDVLSRAVDT